MGYLNEMSESGYERGNIDSFHVEMIPYIVSRYKLDSDAIIVDVGAGQGHCLKPLFDVGYKKLIAIDRDDENFEYFRKKYEVQSYKSDVDNDVLPFENDSIDLIICSHLIEHLHNPIHFLNESRRVLKSGGGMILITPDYRKQYKTFWRDHTHVHPYDKESIFRILRQCMFSDIGVSSWGSRWGLGRLKLFKYVRKAGMIGVDMLAVCNK